MGEFKKIYKNGLIAGTFLFIHPGHVKLFSYALSSCENLYVLLAHDQIIEEKYGIKESTIQDRKEMLKMIKGIKKILEGKKEIDIESVIKKYKIDVVFTCEEWGLKKEMEEKITRMNVQIIKIPCYKKHIYSTSYFLNSFIS